MDINQSKVARNTSVGNGMTYSKWTALVERQTFQILSAFTANKFFMVSCLSRAKFKIFYLAVKEMCS